MSLEPSEFERRTVKKQIFRQVEVISERNLS